LTAGADVVVVDSKQPGVRVDTPRNLDPTRRSGRVTLQEVPITAVDVLPGAAAPALALARTIVAAEAAGGAQDCLGAAVEYAKVREQFGRTIGTFQAIKHHLANMLVAAEAALATVWDAARAAGGNDEQFTLMAACAATLALPAYVKNAELNIQVHGGIGFTWEHDAHLHLRRATTLRAVFGGSSAPGEVFTLAAKGITRENSIDLPPEAKQLREQVRAEIVTWADLDEKSLRQKMIDTGYVMPHWPKPWGRAADAVEQLVIEQEFTAAGIKRPDFSITGWVVLTLIQHGSADQIERFVLPALRGEQVWCQLFSEPGAGSDAAAVSTKATRAEGGWIINGQKVWTSGAQNSQLGLATVRTDPDAAKHAGITTVIVDMSAPGVDVRPLRQITGGSEFNEVFFSDVFVPDNDVVGEPNNGWAVARATLGNERVSIGGGVVGGEGATNILVNLTERLGDRVAGAPERTGRYVADDHALRLLNLRRAARSVAGAEPGPEGNVTKLLLAEHLSERATLSAELLGPDVALVSGPAKMAGLMVLAARGMSIAGGTSEVTRNQIAERILGLPRDPLIK
jgi:3-oxochol-4-en-24-oyl-CoA dehydrogenase